MKEFMMIFRNEKIEGGEQPSAEQMQAVMKQWMDWIGGIAAQNKLADKGNPVRSQLLSIFLLLGGILLIKLFPNSIYSFVIAVLLLDIGVQATQVTNVATIYTLDEQAHSRINTIYMTAYFIGGALGTLIGVQCWHIGGWAAVTWQLIAWGVAALIVTLSSYRSGLKST